jgi:predicted DNA-binding protein (UPF0251 family)
MGRCKKHRCCRFLDDETIYKPRGIPLKDIKITPIEADEFEAIRLCDHEKRSQIEAADKMDISRGTIQRLLEVGRYKLVNAFLNNEGIHLKNTQ